MRPLWRHAVQRVRLGRHQALPLGVTIGRHAERKGQQQRQEAEYRDLDSHKHLAAGVVRVRVPAASGGIGKFEGPNHDRRQAGHYPERALVVKPV